MDLAPEVKLAVADALLSINNEKVKTQLLEWAKKEKNEEGKF